jgi:ribosomal protein L2
MCWKKAELFYEKSGTLLRNLQPSGLRQPKVALVGSNMCSTDQLSDPLIQREKLRDNINLQVATATQQRFYQKIGTNCTLEKVSLGTSLHNIETYPGQGGILVRAAGTFAQLVQKIEKTRQCIVRLPSGRQLLLDLLCRATIGIVSNTSHSTRKLTKAGQSRWLGRMPVVRGVAMNPIDHPHGGRTKGGRPSVSPWGKPTKGSKTSKQPKARKHS